MRNPEQTIPWQEKKPQLTKEQADAHIRASKHLHSEMESIYQKDRNNPDSPSFDEMNEFIDLIQESELAYQPEKAGEQVIDQFLERIEKYKSGLTKLQEEKVDKIKKSSTLVEKLTALQDYRDLTSMRRSDFVDRIIKNLLFKN